MIAQGSDLINKAYFDSVIAKINSATTAADLQNYVDEIFPSLSAQKSAITSQIEALKPFLALATAPSASIIDGAAKGILSWISNLILAQIEPQVTAYTNYAAQMTLLVAKVTELQQAVTSAADKIRATNISIPSI